MVGRASDVTVDMRAIVQQFGSPVKRCLGGFGGVFAMGCGRWGQLACS